MTDEKPPRFDESAAIAEIERLQETLLVARKARTDKSDEFERFIRSFRTPASPRASADVAAQRAAVVPDDPVPAPVSVPPAAGAVASRSPQVAARRPRRLGIAAAATVATVVVIALAIPRHRTGAPSPAPPAAVKAPSAEEAADPPSLPQPAAAPEARTPVQLELRTLGAVWIRVVVDGEKKVEGVVPAAQRLSFRATHSIVVRAGNGGDLLVVSDNHEDKFGAPDQPLTRTFVPGSDQTR